MKKRSVRNGKIDFLRFIFAICVVLNHGGPLMPTNELGKLFAGYSFAVEFFFLVSGYLLMASIEKAEKYSTRPLSEETGSFLVKKYKSVYPDVAVAYVIGVAIIYLFSDTTLLALIQNTWFDLTLLVSSGMNGPLSVMPVWYISSMLIAMSLLYPLIRRHKKLAVRAILPVAITLIFGYLYQNYKTIRGPMEWTGYTFRGNLRAVAELSLGVLCYEVTKKVKAIDFTVFGRIILAVLELVCYGAFICYMAGDVSGIKDFFYLLLLCVAVIISFSHKSAGSFLFDNRFSTFLGQYSLGIYLSHMVLPRRLVQILPFVEALGWKRRLAVYVAAAMVNGLAVLLISGLIRKIGPKIGTGFKKLMTKKLPAETKN